MLYFLFACNLIIPIIMFGFGKLFENHSPKDINGVYGYRTSMSMKNKETWKFAHEYCGRLWSKIGIVMLIVTIVLCIISSNLSEDIQNTIIGVVIIIQTIILVASIFPVEKALRKNFDTNGKRRVDNK